MARVIVVTKMSLIIGKVMYHSLLQHVGSVDLGRLKEAFGDRHRRSQDDDHEVPDIQNCWRRIAGSAVPISPNQLRVRFSRPTISSSWLIAPYSALYRAAHIIAIATWLITLGRKYTVRRNLHPRGLRARRIATNAASPI